MNIFKVFSILIFLFGIAVFGMFGYQWWKNQPERAPTKGENISVTPQVPQKPVIPEPPSDALKGAITQLQGEVKLYPRVGKDLGDLQMGGTVVQGETIWTKEESSTTVIFSDFAQLTLEPKSQVGLVSLLPDQFLLQQASGSATFALKDPSKTLSIRSMRLLTEIQAGEATVTVDQEEGEIRVTMTQGRAKLAIVDDRDVPQIYDLKQGQTAVVDNGERTVEIETSN